MKLSKIAITNFRCFESFPLEFDKQVNVLVGVNGAGKTALLDAIALALFEIVAANSHGGRIKQWRQRKAQKCTLKLSDIHVPPGADSAVTSRKDAVSVHAECLDFYELQGFPSKTPSGKPAPIEWTEYVTYQMPSGFHYESSKSENLNRLHAYFGELWQEIKRSDARAVIPIPVVAYYRANRRIGEMPKLRDVFETPPGIDDVFENALSAGENYEAMCRWFYVRENAELRERLQVKGKKDFEYADLRAAREAVRQTLEGVKRVFFGENPPTLKVAFDRGDQPEETREVEQLSDGYRNLLALVLDFARRLAQAHPRWDDPLKAPGILLIDEIEMHLHPKWQQTVIGNLHKVFPNTQLIVATHSPQVLTTVRRENIHLLGSDHELEQLPADVGTFGAESSRVLQEVFAVHSRPSDADVPTVPKLREYLVLVESQQQDSDRGRELRTELEQALGRSDPDLLAADARISQLKVLKGK